MFEAEDLVTLLFSVTEQDKCIALINGFTDAYGGTITVVCSGICVVAVPTSITSQFIDSICTIPNHEINVRKPINKYPRLLLVKCTDQDFKKIKSEVENCQGHWISKHVATFLEAKKCVETYHSLCKQFSSKNLAFSLYAASQFQDTPALTAAVQTLRESVSRKVSKKAQVHHSYRFPRKRSHSSQSPVSSTATSRPQTIIKQKNGEQWFNVEICSLQLSKEHLNLNLHHSFRTFAAKQDIPLKYLQGAIPHTSSSFMVVFLPHFIDSSLAMMQTLLERQVAIRGVLEDGTVALLVPFNKSSVLNPPEINGQVAFFIPPIGWKASYR